MKIIAILRPGKAYQTLDVDGFRVADIWDSVRSIEKSFSKFIIYFSNGHFFVCNEIVYKNSEISLREALNELVIKEIVKIGDR